MATDVHVEENGPIDSDTNEPNPDKTATRVGTGRVEDVDASLQQGIDAIYECYPYPPPPAYIIIESKYGKSRLSKKPKDGPQMSYGWITGSKRIDNYFGRKPGTRKGKEQRAFDTNLNLTIYTSYALAGKVPYNQGK